jgi:hypothetical protein
VPRNYGIILNNKSETYLGLRYWGAQKRVENAHFYVQIYRIIYKKQGLVWKWFQRGKNPASQDDRKVRQKNLCCREHNFLIFQLVFFECFKSVVANESKRLKERLWDLYYILEECL